MRYPPCQFNETFNERQTRRCAPPPPLRLPYIAVLVGLVQLFWAVGVGGEGVFLLLLVCCGGVGFVWVVTGWVGG